MASEQNDPVRKLESAADALRRAAFDGSKAMEQACEGQPDWVRQGLLESWECAETEIWATIKQIGYRIEDIEEELGGERVR